MPSLRAWEQGSGEPTYRQVVQGPLGHSAREGLHPDVTDLIVVQVELLELWERPVLHRLGKSGEACVANVVAAERKCLHMAHQTNVQSQESAHAKSQGMGTRQ